MSPRCIRSGRPVPRNYSPARDGPEIHALHRHAGAARAAARKTRWTDARDHGRQYMMINRCLSPESWLQALREGQRVQMPAYANRLSVSLCIGKTEMRSYSGLV